jgi:hypothetical protein
MPSARGFPVCPPAQAGNSQARVEPKDSDSWHLLKALVGSMFVDGKTNATITCSTCSYVLQNSFGCYGREIHDLLTLKAQEFVPFECCLAAER